jgi:hypothetical protein
MKKNLFLDFFNVDLNSGLIYLKNQLSIYQNQTLFIQCSNGIQTKVCKANIKIIPVNDFRPNWIQPSPSTFNLCYSIVEVIDNCYKYKSFIQFFYSLKIKECTFKHIDCNC